MLDKGLNALPVWTAGDKRLLARESPVTGLYAGRHGVSMVCGDQY